MGITGMSKEAAFALTSKADFVHPNVVKKQKFKYFNNSFIYVTFKSQKDIKVQAI
jgi:hypothetical protein